ncbi:hypothetical protein [Streptomyces sp. CC228A]|uniref:hypothetical protein n=1 Tax=Streptomyces sp. CC228A TaxID=2898186 RepID=UPI001F27106F|nr:hypothetical protein [Streptomyces sp. CC228A]
MTAFVWRTVGDLRKAVHPAALVACLTAIGMSVVATTLGYREALRTMDGEHPALWVSTPEGALMAAGLHGGTGAGLVLVAGVVAALFGAEYEAGTWASLLLTQPRRRALLARKAACSLGLGLGFILILWLVLLVSGRALHAWAGPDATAFSPSWGAAVGTLLRALLAQMLFVALALLAAVLTRSVVGTVLGSVGPVIALAPLATVWGLVPFLPHAWLAGWLHLTNEAQWTAFIWTSLPSVADPLLNGSELLALVAVSLAVALAATRGDRLLRPTE